jgi:hypothetical protein
MRQRCVGSRPTLHIIHTLWISKHQTHTINIKTSINMDNLDFENDNKILLEVLTVLEPGIFENEKRLRLLDIEKKSLKVLKSV